MALTGNALDWSLIKRVLRYARPYRKIFFWSVVLTISLAALAPLRPWLIEFTVDKYISFNDLQGLEMMILLMLIALLLEVFVKYMHTYYTNVLGQSVVRDKRIDTFNHLTSPMVSRSDTFRVINVPRGVLSIYLRRSEDR